MDKGLPELLDLVGRGGVPTLLMVISFMLWKENRRLTSLAEKNAERNLELLLKMIKVVGRFNRIAGGGDDESDGD